MLTYFSIILTHRSWNAKNMKNDNSVIIEELKLIRRRMERLREGFRLEKENGLEVPNILKLEKLRERSKSVYQMEVIEYSRDIRRLERYISSDQPGKEEADDLSKLCMKEAASLLAHLVSAPNRLMRIFRTGGLRKRGDDT